MDGRGVDYRRGVVYLFKLNKTWTRLQLQLPRCNLLITFARMQQDSNGVYPDKYLYFAADLAHVYFEMVLYSSH